MSANRSAAVFDDIEADLRHLLQELKSSFADMSAAVSRTNASLAGIRSRTVELAGAAEISNGAAQQLSSATRELGEAAREIGSQVTHASKLSDSAAEAGEQATDAVARLKSSSSEISKVVRLIAEVAQQTNLLALNATIEAARAGEAGRGFAVVASEVKQLATRTQSATADVSKKIDDLQADATASIAAVARITQVLSDVRPVYGAVAAAVQQQIASITSLADTASSTASFVESVTIRAREIADGVTEASEVNAAHEQSAKTVDKILTRTMVVLRQNEVANRRESARVPTQRAARLNGVSVQTVDIGLQGCLVTGASLSSLRSGDRCNLEIEDVGTIAATVKATSSSGVHLEFEGLSSSARARLEELLEGIERENAGFLEMARTTAASVEASLSQLVERGSLSAADLFDYDYKKIDGTNPIQYSTRYLRELDRCLPSILDGALGRDRRMVFCAAVDRNGYLPVHNSKFSLPQKPGDVAWNAANCRNRRIFDDRAGLAAARNTQSYLVQSYARDMGNGTSILMKEVDVPLHVAGRHWGALRMAFQM